jgi:hypothetical protein
MTHHNSLSMRYLAFSTDAPPTPAFNQIADCIALTPATIAVAGTCHIASSPAKKVVAGSAGGGACSVWLLDCAPLCAALASNALAVHSQALVHRVKVWTSPTDKFEMQSRIDEDHSGGDVRLLPLATLNLLAVCFVSGSIHLLNTHGENFTIRSSFSRHTQQVHALALCQHEALIISGGISRCVKRDFPRSLA